MRIVTVIMCTVLLLCSILSVEAAGKPSVEAQSSALLCAQSGEFLLENNADKRLPMASTTKIMTAVVALDRCTEPFTVNVGNEILNAEGTLLGLEVGDTIRLYDLVLAMMLSSGNDAANAVAVAVGGSMEGFQILMNAYALDLGLSNTNFITPSGLDSEGHYTTARDLAILTQYALGIPEFAEICSSVRAEIALNDGKKTLKVYNHNKLLSKYEGAIGVKTGFTKKSGRCLVSAAQKNGVTLIAVTLNDADDWNDHIKMLNYGFTAVEASTVQAQPTTISVAVAGTEYSFVECAAEEVAYVCKSERAADVVKRVCVEHFVYAPVNAGDCIGYVEYVLDGRVIAKAPLCVLSAENKNDLTANANENGSSIIAAFINKIIGWFTDGRN